MLALLLLGAVVLRDDVVRIPPQHKWRYDRFVVTEKTLPVIVKCSFKLKSGGKVRVELISDSDLEALRTGNKYDVIQASSTGNLDQEIGVPGTFDIVLWNDDDSRPADVALKMALDFTSAPAGQAQTLSRQRQITVILLSIVGFFTILGVSIRQLLKAMAATSSQIPDGPESIPPIPGPDPD